MFSQFQLAKYRLIIEAGKQGLELPRYKGSTLRGGFGHVFRRICCSQPGQGCSACLLAQACPYACIFEPSPPPGSEVLKNYNDIPRPFLIEPPLDTKTRYEEGEKLAFQLVVIGQAIQYLPYFILAFKELGSVGIGKGRLPYTLSDILAIDIKDGLGVSIYDGSTGTILPAGGEKSISRLEDYADNACTLLEIEYLTMTRVKFDHALTKDIPFHVLIRNLLRRISTLYYFFHDRRTENIDYKALIAQAEQVKTVSSNLKLVDWERYSQRQHTRMSMGGMVGKVVYEGGIGGFMPLIRLGEVIHVGKGCVFGLGRYEVRR